jgi:hypothetical protein
LLAGVRGEAEDEYADALIVCVPIHHPPPCSKPPRPARSQSFRGESRRLLVGQHWRKRRDRLTERAIREPREDGGTSSSSRCSATAVLYPIHLPHSDRAVGLQRGSGLLLLLLRFLESASSRLQQQLGRVFRRGRRLLHPSHFFTTGPGPG